VYICPSFELRPPLPTAESSDAIWGEVTDANSWRRKFARGLTRFGVTSDYMPRALSEENLLLDRLNARRWFILGGSPWEPRPRFDIRFFDYSPTFGVRNLLEEFRKTGGVAVFRNGRARDEFGEPAVKWTDATGWGTYIYCSPGLKGRLGRDGTDPTAY
jgi:hypothetical protein